MPITIHAVTPNSLCATHGVQPGDLLCAINGRPICDGLDYSFHATQRRVRLEFERDRKPYVLTFTKGEYDDLGLEFETFLASKHKGCKNKCVFCFIDQLPKGMRKSLYFKDDDERLSYLMGNYITLTNLTQAEADRICEMKLSPMNISVHTTDPELRVQMLRNPHAGECLRFIRQFDEAGIQLNFQLVLCPGINDGAALERSIRELMEYRNVQSVAAVPVGLTAHREGLAELKPFDAESAAAVIDTLETAAQKALDERGSRIFAASDEFYLLAGRALPDEEFYEDFYQLENGVGMLTLLRSQFDAALALQDEAEPDRRLLIATGEAAFATVSELVDRFNQKFGTRHAVRAVKNLLFGGQVTVTGLLSGGDLLRGIGSTEGFSAVLICDTMLKSGEQTFLDDMTVEQLTQHLGLPVCPLENDGGVLVDALSQPSLLLERSNQP